MRFLVDECVGPTVARWLRSIGHEVYSVYEEARSMRDDDILAKANAESWTVITNDRDYGTLIFREHRPHQGVIFLRLTDETPASVIDALERLFQNQGSQLPGRFVVVTDTHVRFAKT